MTDRQLNHKWLKEQSGLGLEELYAERVEPPEPRDDSEDWHS